jgi:hypothetical protein
MNTDTRTFRTERLNAAIYLLATKSLRLQGLEEIEPGKIEFTFADPEDRGAEYEFAFDRGATVCANSLFAAQVFLRREMTKQLKSKSKQSIHGESHERSDRYSAAR